MGKEKCALNNHAKLREKLFISLLFPFRKKKIGLKPPSKCYERDEIQMNNSILIKLAFHLQTVSNPRLAGLESNAHYRFRCHLLFTYSQFNIY